MENFDFSNITLYVFIVIALALFFGLRVLTWLLPALIRGEERRKIVWRYKSLFEMFVWGLFLIWAVRYLYQSNQPYSVALFVLLILFLLYSGWIGLKDFVAGAFLKAGHKLALNESIKVGDFLGTIIRFGYSSLVLETDSGETVYLPYSYLFGKVIVKSHPAESILRYTFRVEIPPVASIRKAIEEINLFVLNLPWISLTKEPQIKSMSETSSGHLLEITLYSFAKNHFQDMEKMITERFAIPQKAE
jgi:hypothetical protein